MIISWDSDKSSKAYVQYGTTPASLLLSVPSRDELQTAAGDSNHRISIKTFKPNTNYYFRIRVGDEVTAYNDWEVFDNGGIPYSFKTKGVTIAEGSPTPTVASIQPSTMVTPEVTPEMVDNGLLSQESCVTGWIITMMASLMFWMSFSVDQRKMGRLNPYQQQPHRQRRHQLNVQLGLTIPVMALLMC